MPNSIQFVAQCRQYLGTPFRHQGRLPGEGLDCVGVAICAARALGVEINDDTTYKMKPNAGLFLRKLREHCYLIPSEEMDIGDLLIFSYDGNPQHVAILSNTEPMQIIHAAISHKSTVEHGLDEKLMDQLAAVFRIKGLDR